MSPLQEVAVTLLSAIVLLGTVVFGVLRLYTKS